MTFTPEHATVWSELPVTDLDKAQAYYKALGFGDFTVLTDGPNPIAIFHCKDPMGNVAGHLYPGKPAPRGTGPTVHLAAPTALDQVAADVTAAGGTVLSEPVQIPGGAFIYTEDPDGNSVAFFKAA